MAFEVLTPEIEQNFFEGQPFAQQLSPNQKTQVFERLSMFVNIVRGAREKEDGTVMAIINTHRTAIVFVFGDIIPGRDLIARRDDFFRGAVHLLHKVLERELNPTEIVSFVKNRIIALSYEDPDKPWPEKIPGRPRSKLHVHGFDDSFRWRRRR